jgi:hypothetical protein
MKIGFFNGVTITNWALTLTTGSSYTSFGFSVGAQFGSTEVDGYLRFDGDQFEVIGFGIEGTLSIGDLLTRIGVPVSWGDLLPISFDPIPPNAAMRLYYAADNWSDPDNGSVYVKGVNFDWCRITIFGAKADVSASIDSNVTVTGGLPEPLNLGILALTGETAQGRGAKGPSLIASTANGGSFTLAAGVAFCGSPFADTPVTIAKNSDGQYQFSGSITYTGDDLPITPPPISFVWDEKNGFQVTAWSILDFP